MRRSREGAWIEIGDIRGRQNQGDESLPRGSVD